MGREKDNQIMKEENWNELARAKGWKCSICTELAVYPDAPDSLTWVSKLPAPNRKGLACHVTEGS